MTICTPNDIHNFIVTAFKERNLIPIVGSGVSCGTEASRGTVPSGKQYWAHMCDTLAENPQFSTEELEQIRSSSFSVLCDY